MDALRPEEQSSIPHVYHVSTKGLLKKKHYFLNIVSDKNCIQLRDLNSNEVNEKQTISFSKIAKVDVKGEEVIIHPKKSKKKTTYLTKTPHQLLGALLPMLKSMKSPVEQSLPLEIVCIQMNNKKIKRNVTLSLHLSSYSRDLRQVSMSEKIDLHFSDHSYRHIHHFTVFNDSPTTLAFHLKPSRTHLFIFEHEEEKNHVMRVIQKLTKHFFGGIPGSTVTCKSLDRFIFFEENQPGIPLEKREESLNSVQTISNVEKFRVITDYIDVSNLPRRKGKVIRMLFLEDRFLEFDLEDRLVVGRFRYDDVFRIVRYRKHSVIIEYRSCHPFLYKFGDENLRDSFLTTLLEGCKRVKKVVSIDQHPSNPQNKVNGREVYEPEIEELYLKRLCEDPIQKDKESKKKGKKKKRKVDLMDFKDVMNSALMNVRLNGDGGVGGKVNKKLVPRVVQLVQSIQQALEKNTDWLDENKKMYLTCEKDDLLELTTSGLRVLVLLLSIKKYYNPLSTELVQGKFNKILDTCLRLKDQPLLQFYALQVIRFGMDRAFPYKSENKEKNFKLKIFTKDFVNVLFDVCLACYRNDHRKYSLPLYELLGLLDLLIYSGVSSTHKKVYHYVVFKISENVNNLNFFVYFSSSFGIVYYSAVLLKVYVTELHALHYEMKDKREKLKKGELTEEEEKLMNRYRNHQLKSLEDVSFLIYFRLTLVSKDRLLMACLADIIGLLSHDNVKYDKLYEKMFPNGEIMKIDRYISTEDEDVEDDDDDDDDDSEDSEDSDESDERKKKDPELEEAGKKKKQKKKSKKKEEEEEEGEEDEDEDKDEEEQPKEKKKKKDQDTATEPSTPETPDSSPSKKTRKVAVKKQKKYRIIFAEPHSTKLFHAKSNKLNLYAHPKVRMDRKYWRKLVYDLQIPTSSMYLVWNSSTIRELSQICRKEVNGFLQMRDRYGTRMKWNYFEFTVNYECLKQEPVVGTYFVRHIRNEDFKSGKMTVANPRKFLEQLHHVFFFRDDDIFLRETCIRACTALYNNFAKQIGDYIFMDSLILFMDTKMKINRKTVALECLRFLRSLFRVKKNIHEFILAGGTKILLHNLNTIYEEPELRETGTMIYDMKVSRDSVLFKITNICIDLLTKLCTFRSCLDDEQDRLIPVPRAIRAMCKSKALNRIVQCLLIPDEVIYQKIIQLLSILSYNDSVLNRMYHTGFFYFIFMYTGKDFFQTLRLILKFHLRQSGINLKEVFTGENDDYTQKIPSALHGLIPREYIYQLYLVNKMTSKKMKKKRASQALKLSKIYTMEKYFSPLLVWGSEMRTSMINQIKEQLHPFFLQIQKEGYIADENSEFLKKMYESKQVLCKFKSLENEFVCGHYYMRYFVHLGRWTKYFEKEFKTDKPKIQVLLYSITMCLKHRKKEKKELGMCVKALLILFQIEREIQIGIFSKYYKKLKHLMDFTNFVTFEQPNLSDRDIVIIYQSILFMDVIIRSSYQKVNYVKIINFIMRLIIQFNSIIGANKIDTLQMRTDRVKEKKERRKKWETKLRPFDLTGLNIDERLYEILLLSMDYLFFLTDKYPKLLILYKKRDSIMWNLFMDFFDKYPEQTTKEIKGKVLNLMPLLSQSPDLQSSLLMKGGLLLYVLHYVNTPCAFTKLATDVLQKLITAIKMSQVHYKVPFNPKVKLIIKKVFPNKTEFACEEERKNLKMMTEANKIFNKNMSNEMNGILVPAIEKLVASRKPKQISTVDLTFLEEYVYDCMRSEVCVREVYLKLFNVFPSKRRKELICSDFINGLLDHYQQYIETENEEKLRVTMESLYICSKYQESTPFFKVLEKEEEFAKSLVTWCDWEKNYEIFTFVLKFLTKLSVYMPSSFFLILIKHGFLPCFHKVLRYRNPNRFFQQCQNMVAFILYHCLNKLQSKPEEDRHHFEVFIFTCLSVLVNAEADNGHDEWYHKRVAILFSQILHRYPDIQKRVRLLFPPTAMYVDLYKNFPIIGLQCFTKNRYQKPEFFWSREALVTIQKFVRSGLEREKLTGIDQQIETRKTVLSELVTSRLSYPNLPICTNGIFLKSYVFHPNYHFEYNLKNAFIDVFFKELISVLKKQRSEEEGEEEEGEENVQVEAPDTPQISPSGNIFDKNATLPPGTKKPTRALPSSSSKRRSRGGRGGQAKEGIRSRRIRYLVASILTFLGGKDHIIKAHLRFCSNKNIAKYILECFKLFKRYDNMEVGMKIIARLLSGNETTKFVRSVEELHNDVGVIDHVFEKYLRVQLECKKEDNVELGLSCLLKLMLEYKRLSSKFQTTTDLILTLIPYVEEEDDDQESSDEEDEDSDEDGDKEGSQEQKKQSRTVSRSKHIKQPVLVLMKQFFFLLKDQRPGIFSSLNKISMSKRPCQIISTKRISKDVHDQTYFGFRDRKLYKGHVVEFMNMVPKLDPMSMQNEETMLFNHKKFMNKAVKESMAFLDGLGSQKGKMFIHKKKKRKKREEGMKKRGKWKETTHDEDEENRAVDLVSDMSDMSSDDEDGRKMEEGSGEEESGEEDSEEEGEDESGEEKGEDGGEGEDDGEEEEDVVGVESSQTTTVQAGGGEIQINLKEYEGLDQEEREKKIKEQIRKMKKAGGPGDMLFDLSSDEEEEEEDQKEGDSKDEEEKDGEKKDDEDEKDVENELSEDEENLFGNLKLDNLRLDIDEIEKEVESEVGKKEEDEGEEEEEDGEEGDGEEEEDGEEDVMDGVVIDDDGLGKSSDEKEDEEDIIDSGAEEKKTDEDLVEMEIKEMKLMDGMDDMMKLFEDDDYFGEDVSIDIDDDDEEEEEEVKEVKEKPKVEEEKKDDEEEEEVGGEVEVEVEPSPSPPVTPVPEDEIDGNIENTDVLDLSLVLDDMIAANVSSSDENSGEEKE